MDKVKLNRIGFAVDCKKFVEELKSKCVAYNAPMKPEDGLQRIIYQISPTLHLEVAVWIWVENKELQQYASVFAAYHDEEEFLKFVDDIYKRLRKTGNTEAVDKPGFAEMMSEMVKPS